MGQVQDLDHTSLLVHFIAYYNHSALEDNFPNVFRFTASVFPSNSDDVNTSPYNSLLASTKLIEHADCVLPIDNEALIRMVTQFSDAEEDAKLNES